MPALGLLAAGVLQELLVGGGGGLPRVTQGGGPCRPVAT